MLAVASAPSQLQTFSNVGLMLAQRRRRWTSINPALGERTVFAWISNSTCRHLATVQQLPHTAVALDARICPGQVIQ